ncbi:MAG: M20 family metallo-hydrolase [candidate division WOR-3 bacterium]|nr:M20 family metallo-hydrolase [candidate division WOR-3 bacterium]MCX7836346.1 M20 family metallo-hydrolase [candidate division WOR-3 bacterium]MDW8113549.1 M20 family metallo-hydrolase [candidate division WOR-3 bacterium]
MWEKEKIQKILKKIEEYKEEIIDLQKNLTEIPAIGPENNGEGEYEKAMFLKEKLLNWGLAVKEYNVVDERVKNKIRPNLLAFYPGKEEDKKIWIITHLDVVPAGNEELWETPPFKAVVKDGKIYGRGTEDNQQEMVSSIFALRIIKDLNLTPFYSICLLFVSDEETGSKYGIKYLLENFNLFNKEDLIIIPDAGSEKGDTIEIAEKGIIWLKFKIIGYQTHASTPHKGINAHKIGAYLITYLSENFEKKFNKKDYLFEPPVTTFEPTKKENNIPNINTIPGEDVFYFDCRYLPDYSFSEIIVYLKEIISFWQEKYKVKIDLEVIHHEEVAPKTKEDALIVKFLKKAVEEVLNQKPKLIGIGGGTVAAIFRKKGFQPVVWGKVCGVAHQPNEYSLIENMIDSTKVYAYLFGLDLKDF